MRTRLLGVEPSMHERLQKYAAAQRPMTLSEYLRKHTSSDVHLMDEDSRKRHAIELAKKFSETKPKVDVATAEALSPEEQYAIEHIKERAEASQPEARKPVGRLPHGGVEEWGKKSPNWTQPEDRPAPSAVEAPADVPYTPKPRIPMTFDFTPRERTAREARKREWEEQHKAEAAASEERWKKTFPESNRLAENQTFLDENAHRAFMQEQPASRMINGRPLHEIEKVLQGAGWEKQFSDPHGAYLRSDAVQQAKQLDSHVGQNEDTVDLVHGLASTPYDIYNAAQHVSSQEDLEKIQKAFEEHKEKRRSVFATPTLDITDKEPRVHAWRDAKELAELGVPLNNPYAEMSRLLATNEHHAQRALDAKHKEILMRDPEVMSLEDAKELADKARVEGYQRASDTAKEQMDFLRDIHTEKLKGHQNLLQSVQTAAKAEKERLSEEARKTRIAAHSNRVQGLLQGAGLPGELEKHLTENLDHESGSVDSVLTDRLGYKPTTKGLQLDPTIQAAIGAPSVEPLSLTPPRLPTKLPNVPDKGIPLTKEHLSLSKSLAPHEAMLATHKDPAKVEAMKKVVGDLRAFRDTQVPAAPAPAPQAIPSWGTRFWKGVEGIGDMIPGIHEGSNKYLRRAAGIALPLGVAGGTALLAHHYLNKKNEESDDENQPRKMASLSLFQTAGVR